MAAAATGWAASEATSDEATSAATSSDCSIRDNKSITYVGLYIRVFLSAVKNTRDLDDGDRDADAAERAARSSAAEEEVYESRIGNFIIIRWIESWCRCARKKKPLYRTTGARNQTPTGSRQERSSV